MFKTRWQRPMDDKGRASVPAPYRRILGDDPPVLVQYDKERPFLALLPQDVWDVAWSEMKRDRREAGDLGDMLREILSRAHDTPIDAQGRIRIPNYLAKKVHITGQVLFVGLGDRIELWNPDVFADWKRDPNPNYDPRVVAIFG